MKLELHLTYVCNLACRYCNRGSNFATGHTRDMTVADVLVALREISEPVERIILIGGEPTLHNEVVEIARLCLAACRDVVVYSNEFLPRSRDVLEKLASLGIRNLGGSEKRQGSADFGGQNATVMWSPADFGHARTEPCAWAGTRSCGYSVDAAGMTACAIGGFVDGVLGLGVRGRVGLDLAEARRLLPELCAHCGSYWPYDQPSPLFAYRGHLVSREWLAALERWEA